MRNEIIGPREHATPSSETIESVVSKIFQKLEDQKRVKSEVSKTYAKQFHVGHSEIKNLVTQIEQELAHVEIVLRRLDVSLTYSNSMNARFADWDSFSAHDTSQPEYISDLAIELNYTVSIPGNSQRDQFKIEVGLRTDVGLADRVIHEAFEPDSHPPTIRASVEYTNYIIAKNMFSTIDRWIESLSEVEGAWDFPKLRRSTYISFSRYLIRTAALFSAIAFGYMTLTWTTDTQAGFAFWVLSVALCFAILDLFTFWCANRFVRWISATSSLSAIDITKGDKRRLQRMKDENRNLIIRSTSYFLGGAASIPFALVAAWLAKYLFG